MTWFVLVRHGETIWQAEGRYAGSSDVPLTPHGLQEAERLANWAREARLEAVWSSRLRRARMTGEMCARAAGMLLCEDERLGEVDFGIAEGNTLADLAARYPDAVAGFQQDPVANHFPRGEDPQGASRRGIDALRDIERAHPFGRVLVVCHGTLIRLMLCELLGLPLSRYRGVFPEIRNCALTEIRLDEAGVAPAIALLELNRPV